MRSLVAAWILLGSGFSSLACAHSASEELESPDVEADAQMARLRHENASLREQVRNLEEQLRYFERSGSAGIADAGPSSRQLPVVKLAPDADAEPRPTHMREAVSLSPLPNSSPYAQLQAEDDFESEPSYDSPYAAYEPSPAPEPTPAPAPAPAPSASGDDVRSYKLVGTRLVDLTKTRRPPAPPKRSRTRRADKKKRTGIIAQYDSAMSVYKEGRFADAESAFHSFVERYPEHDYADNALYWKGEAAYDQAHYADALAAFTEVVERYGGGNKAPDALLKIGLCYGKLGDAANAKDVLTQLIAAYPEARATQIAHSKLAEF